MTLFICYDNWMALIYITGPSGSGKSSLTEVLRRRGIEAHDADIELCSWHDNATGQQVVYPRSQADRDKNWQQRNSFLMSEDKIAELYDKAKETNIYVLGIAPNDLELASKYFKYVFCLYIDETTMVNRIISRQNNNYGKAPDQMKIIRFWYAPTVQKYKDAGCVMIDANKDIQQVADEILTAA